MSCHSPHPVLTQKPPAGAAPEWASPAGPQPTVIGVLSAGHCLLVGPPLHTKPYMKPQLTWYSHFLTGGITRVPGPHRVWVDMRCPFARQSLRRAWGVTLGALSRVLCAAARGCVKQRKWIRLARVIYGVGYCTRCTPVRHTP
jgi:hypothetical protein